MTGFEKVEPKIKTRGRDGRRKNGGKRPGSGRKRGVPNKLTKDLKELIRGALDAVGGQAYLEEVAKVHPATFCALLARILPLQHAGEVGATLLVTHTIDRPPEESREEWLTRRARELGAVAASIQPITSGRAN